MHDEFWSIYQQVAFSKFYYQIHLNRIRLILFWVNLLPVIITTIGTSGLFFLQGDNLAWLIIVLTGQLISWSTDYLNLSKKKWSVEQYIDDISSQLTILAKNWRVLNSRTDNDLDYDYWYDIISKHDSSYESSKSRFLSDFTFKEVILYSQMANKEADSLLKNKHC